MNMAPKPDCPLECRESGGDTTGGVRDNNVELVQETS